MGYCENGWDEIVPGLFQGGHDKAGAEYWRPLPVRVADEFDLVVSLYERDGYGPADGVDHLHHRMPDRVLRPEDAAEVEALADLAAEAHAAGRKVLVRCQAGLNRSGLVVALTMLRLGWNAEESIAQIRHRRSPDALFNDHFCTYLRKREGAHR